MRTRLLLTAIALGATTLVGGAATAQAVPAASSQTNVTAIVAGSWKPIGTGSESWCYSMAASYRRPRLLHPGRQRPVRALRMG